MAVNVSFILKRSIKVNCKLIIVLPYEVGGDSTEDNPEDFMLLSGSAN
jgi:hypothetical protein